MEKHGICDRVFKAIKTKKHHSFICFDIEEFYPSISQDLLNRVLDLASTYDVTNDEETSCNTCKTFDPYAQTATLVKEGRYSIWRPNGQLRRCWNMRASRKPSSFPNFETSTSDFSFQTPHREKQITENLPRFFRRGVVRSCFVMVEEYSTIAERFLTTPRRKNRVVSTHNALESLLLLQLWYDHSLLRHIRLQVYQEPLSDRLVKGIWRWHAKDDIYKTF